MDRIIELLHFYFGLFPDRVKDPYVALTRAEIHLLRVYSTPAMRERGGYLPEQAEAFNILLKLQKEIKPYSRGWVVPKEEIEID